MGEALQLPCWSVGMLGLQWLLLGHLLQEPGDLLDKSKLHVEATCSCLWQQFQQNIVFQRFPLVRNPCSHWSLGGAETSHCALPEVLSCRLGECNKWLSLYTTGSWDRLLHSKEYQNILGTDCVTLVRTVTFLKSSLYKTVT